MNGELKKKTDEELAAMVAGRATEAVCSELFARYERKIFLWCYNYMHDTEEAIDATQEIFIRIFRGIGGFAGRSAFSTWVYRIARNHCLGELAKTRHRFRTRTVPVDDRETLDCADGESARSMELGGDLDRLVGVARRVMRPEELDAFVLHYRDGLSVREVTRILGCGNVTGARTLIQNARRKFRRMIREGESGNERS
ncbi:MAG: RNA polymerase sigma factor [Candidatus Krumholzibacteriota bacterium]|nr:RNA polymerase sigma factor [Candidatus Krumholzibacteriota bacterium]